MTQLNLLLVREEMETVEYRIEVRREGTLLGYIKQSIDEVGRPHLFLFDVSGLFGGVPYLIGGANNIMEATTLLIKFRDSFDAFVRH